MDDKLENERRAVAKLAAAKRFFDETRDFFTEKGLDFPANPITTWSSHGNINKQVGGIPYTQWLRSFYFPDYNNNPSTLTMITFGVQKMFQSQSLTYRQSNKRLFFDPANVRDCIYRIEGFVEVSDPTIAGTMITTDFETVDRVDKNEFQGFGKPALYSQGWPVQPDSTVKGGRVTMDELIQSMYESGELPHS